MKNKKQKQLDIMDTVIGTTTSIDGTIKVDSSIRIEGKVSGTIDCSGDLTVGPEGLIEADVHARNVEIAGTIKGDIDATGTIHIDSKGKVQGNATMKAFIIEEGGIFEGQSNMNYSDNTKKSDVKSIEENTN